MINVILNVIDIIINPLIILGGVVTGFFLWNLSTKFSALKKEIDKALNGTKYETVVNRETLAVTKKALDTTARTDVYELKKRFDDQGSKFVKISQIIPVFPLFGILGTVAGLMMQVNAKTDADLIYDSLDTALSSTFWGLIFAIILKMVVAIAVAPTINDIENMFSDNEKQFRDALELGNLEQSSERSEDEGKYSE